MAASQSTSLYPNPFFQLPMWYQNNSARPNDSRTSMSIASGSSAPSGQAHRPISLTISLLESQPFALKTATESPFILAAGQGKLTKSTLSKWLSQVRLVTQAQLGLVGALVARIDLPYVSMTPEAKAQSLRWRMVNVLTHSLNQAQHDLAFFESVAAKYDLDLEFPPQPDLYFTASEPATQLIHLYRAFWTDPTMSLLEGLAVLWCTLHCRLASWRCAANQLSPFYREDLDSGATRKEFVPRWTDTNFEAYVAELANVTNLLYERNQSGKELATFRTVWQHVLDIERMMWPEIFSVWQPGQVREARETLRGNRSPTHHGFEEMAVALISHLSRLEHILKRAFTEKDYAHYTINHPQATHRYLDESSAQQERPSKEPATIQRIAMSAEVYYRPITRADICNQILELERSIKARSAVFLFPRKRLTDTSGKLNYMISLYDYQCHHALNVKPGDVEDVEWLIGDLSRRNRQAKLLYEKLLDYLDDAQTALELWTSLLELFDKVKIALGHKPWTLFAERRFNYLEQASKHLQRDAEKALQKTEDAQPGFWEIHLQLWKVQLFYSEVLEQFAAQDSDQSPDEGNSGQSSDEVGVN